MRNDVLVVRVANGEEAKKVIDFVNGLGYKSSISLRIFLATLVCVRTFSF